MRSAGIGAFGEAQGQLFVMIEKVILALRKCKTGREEDQNFSERATKLHELLDMRF